ncbi:MAG: hypothetical protein PQJ59_05260 [Spirochaetales bacterium]|nr:hypothetical protein [Spirochaetales bacterium]
MELSRTVRTFQEEKKDWEPLKSRIILFVYQWGLNKKRLGEEEAADFLLDFMPRIKAVTLNYNHYDTPFECYLKVCLEWHLRKYTAEKERNRKRELLYWQTAGYQEMLEACEPAPAYGEKKAPKKSPLTLPQKRFFKKRFLLYLLYYVDRINPNMIANYANYLDMPSEELRFLIEGAEELIHSKRKRRKEMMDKKRSYFIDHKYMEMKLNITNTAEKREEILEKIDYLNHKMDSLKIRASRIKMTPTVDDLSRLTGYSSSTISRDLKVVRTYLTNHRENEDILFPGHPD